MKINTKKDLSEVVRRIQENKFSGIEMRVLLIALRFKSTQTIFDLANFIAHEGERDRGILRNNMKDFVDKFTVFVESGGSLTANSPVFTQKEIVNDLYKALQTQDIYGLDERLFKVRSFEIMSTILYLIADTKIETDNPKISEARVSEVQETDTGIELYFSFNPINSPGNFIVAKTVRTLALVAHR